MKKTISFFILLFLLNVNALDLESTPKEKIETKDVIETFEGFHKLFTDYNNSIECPARLSSTTIEEENKANKNIVCGDVNFTIELERKSNEVSKQTIKFQNFTLAPLTKKVELSFSTPYNTIDINSQRINEDSNFPVTITPMKTIEKEEELLRGYQIRFYDNWKYKGLYDYRDFRDVNNFTITITKEKELTALLSFEITLQPLQELIIDPQGDIGSGLVGHYWLDENAGTTIADRNISGGFPGTCFGASWISGYTNSGLYFDGIDDYCDMGDTNASDTQPFSFSAWISDANTTSGQHTIVGNSRQVSTGSSANQVYLESDAGKFKTTSQRGSGASSATEVGNHDLNTWYHVVGVYHSDTNRALYINGVLDINNTASEIMSTTFDKLTLGAHFDNSTPIEYFKGIIDEVRIYNRALGSDDIRNIYYCTPRTTSGNWIIDQNYNCNLDRNVTLSGDLDIKDGQLTIKEGNTLNIRNPNSVYMRKSSNSFDQIIYTEKNAKLQGIK